ncbi:MAG: HIT domain-containing protein, partial [Gammaproteobacteria bacterium]|nr:HIT domain-containing protein [Gammaproteobacteria bacterium]
KMRMSHIYQPVMIRELLTNNGSAAVKTIATSLLMEDRSQIEYYEQITKNMVGRVLTKNRGITRKDGSSYSLEGYAELTHSEVQELVALCDQKICEYIEARGTAIWAHRKRSGGYISGTLRYEILRRAKFRCELCGVSASEKALEVDHIVPRNLGGSDDETNLQALCYSCNAMKRDRDDTDFRGISELYQHRVNGCVFCQIGSDRIVDEDDLVIAVRDNYPVTDLHTLIIPKRHVEDYFALFQPELNAIDRMMQKCRATIIDTDAGVSGFNMGVNSGEAAGQTVFHCHVHLIPRRVGDAEQPRGGVRGVIPSRQSYEAR